MSSKVVKFNNKDCPEFYRELNRRVNKYFNENKISRHANARMVIKTIFMVSLYFVPLVLMLTGVAQTAWPILGLWVLMGFGMSGIGLSIMHDANHGSYSSNTTVNNILGFILNFVGGYHVNWKIQHNVLHHSFTNINEYDDDISKGVMRFSPDQPNKPRYKNQAYYALALYSIMNLYWITVKDFQQVKRYSEQGLMEAQGLTYRSALMRIIFHKTWYAVLTLVLPSLLFPQLMAWHLLGFLIMQLISGLILALIFQPAHVVEEADFYTVDENQSVENSWAVLQLRTTTNFAHKSKGFSWFIGGLNYQIEHHLFPTICHVHYRNLSPIVKQTAEEYNLPYYEQETFYGALKSHFSLLHKLGRGIHPQDLKEQKTQEPVLA